MQEIMHEMCMNIVNVPFYREMSYTYISTLVIESLAFLWMHKLKLIK